jgi:uncharacterized protein with FMN-binding domain
MLFFNRGMGEIKAMSIKDIDIARLPDGEYRGSFSRGRWSYDVTVKVAAGAIASVSVNSAARWEQENTKFTDALVSALVARQSLRIDAVSGASVSTKAFLKAVENALTSR